MEKRALLAVGLSIAVFYLYSFLVPAPQKKPVELPAPLAAVATQPQLSKAQETPAPLPAVAAAKDIKVETDLYAAVFSSQGGVLKRLALKKYKDTAGAAGKPVALFSEEHPDSFPLRTGITGVPIDPKALWSASSDGFTLAGGDKRKIDFFLNSPNGVVIKKSYTFTGNDYAIDLDTQLANRGAAKLSGATQLAIPFPLDPKHASGQMDVYGPVTRAEGKVVTEKLKDVTGKEKSYDRGVNWSGFHDKYFLTSVMAKDGSIASVRIKGINANTIESTFTSPAFAINPSEAVTASYRLYFGPKDLDILKAQGNNLEEAIDLGWFSALAKPLLHSLKFFYRFTGNYGVAIIIITVILKLIFFPLTHKSYKSMKEMQKLQPKMAQLKEKLKNDRDAMNRAIMELYKEHKVNPLGGCLPMVVQIPVFFALYKALMFSIELRHAPFFFWITDLSGKDPYYVTPIIMGITMFIQQKMTPSQMDPTQAKMMMALPVVFTFMFLNFPAGLVLYWLVNNILTIAQQYYINRLVAD